MDTELVMWLARVEAKLDLVMSLLSHGVVGVTTSDSNGENNEGDDRGEDVFHSLTPKQHAVMQMVARGASNQEVAERLGVSLNTAKVHLRLIARKAGMTRRDQLAAWYRGLHDECDPATYQMITGGLHKFWDGQWPAHNDRSTQRLLRPRGEEE